jgi:hypothetical protein
MHRHTLARLRQATSGTARVVERAFIRALAAPRGSAARRARSVTTPSTSIDTSTSLQRRKSERQGTRETISPCSLFEEWLAPNLRYVERRFRPPREAPPSA